MSDEFDLSRLSNAGKEAARAHKNLRKVALKLKALDKEARAAGFSANQIDGALFGFCSTEEECSDAASLFLAMKEIAAKESKKETT